MLYKSNPYISPSNILTVEISSAPTDILSVDRKYTYARIFVRTDYVPDECTRNIHEKLSYQDRKYHQEIEKSVRLFATPSSHYRSVHVFSTYITFYFHSMLALWLIP